MNGVKLVLLGLLLALALLVVAIAARNPKPSYLPGDADHANTGSIDACLQCHGPGKPDARSLKHPPVNDCMRCHAHRDR